MRGTLRWMRADLRARRGQALLTVGVVGGVVAALFLATMLLQGAVNPWQQLFARTRGADVLIYFRDGTSTSELRSVPGVQAVARPYQAASATLEQGAVKSPVELRAMTAAPPAMSAPLIVAGSWLRPSDPDGVVLEASFAAAVHVGVGDRIMLDGIDGTSVQTTVIGIADTADQGFYPQWTPGLVWGQHRLLSRVEPNASETEEVVGLRLHDNSAMATGQVVQTIWNLATLVVNTTILTALGVTSGTAAGLVVAPRLINMQGQTSGIGSGIAASLGAPAVAEILATALAIGTAAALFLARRTIRRSDAADLRGPARPLPKAAPLRRS